MEPTYRIAQRLHERRAAKGLQTYGRHLDANSQGCMLVHALKEAADQVNYLLAEIQRRRTAIKLMLEVAEVLTARGMHRDAVRVVTMIDLLGGESALAQYDEILGTVAQNATVDPRDEALRVAEEALDPIARAYRVSMEPFAPGIDETDGAHHWMPRGWPSVKDFKNANLALAAIRAAGGAR